MEPVVRAADLGYGFTKYVRDVRPGHLDCASFPSMAPVAPEVGLADAMGKRRTVVVEIDGVKYEVGPDVELAQRAVAVRNMDDEYIRTPHYLALLRGALHYMRKDVIDVLVVGLPVSLMKLRCSELERLVAGAHPVGRDRSVTVRHVRVLAQPHGALLDYASRAKDGSRVLRQTNLVIDCGYRTLDWLLTEGLKPVESRSGSVPRGMYDVLREIADRIGNSTGSRYFAYSKLDAALRRDERPVINGRTVNIDSAIAAARQIAVEGVTEMKRALQGTSDIDNIVLVGGSAFFFKPALESLIGNRSIIAVREAEFANLRGFQIAGVDWAARRARERAAAA